MRSSPMSVTAALNTVYRLCVNFVDRTVCDENASVIEWGRGLAPSPAESLCLGAETRRAEGRGPKGRAEIFGVVNLWGNGSELDSGLPQVIMPKGVCKGTNTFSVTQNCITAY